MASQEIKFKNLALIVGTVTSIDTHENLLGLQCRIPRKNKEDLLIQHAVQASDELLEGLEAGQRIQILGRLLTLNGDDGREIQTIVEAKTIGEPDEKYADGDISKAKIIGKMVRDASVFGRRGASSGWATLRMFVGQAYVWIRANGSFLHSEVVPKATNQSILEVYGNLGYRELDTVTLTEISAYSKDTSRVIMQAAVTSEFDGIDDDEGEAIDMPQQAAMATAGAGVGQDDIPF